MSVKVKEIMHTDIMCIPSSMTVGDARDELVAKGVSGAPVVDGNGEIVGVFSQTDLLRGESFEDIFSPSSLQPESNFSESLGKKSVGEIMGSNLFVASPNNTASEVARMMTTHLVHRIIIVENKKPVGIISSIDLLKLID